MLRKLLAPSLALLLLAPVAVAQPVPGERYYMTLFGAQSVPFRNRLTHTFAEFTRTVPTPYGEAVAESHTVSWLPATLRIRVFALRPEPGVNLSLQQTFDWVASFGGRVSGWGPYELGPDRYYPTLQRKAELESGAILYRAVGAVLRSDPISNCGQSFTRADPVLGRRFQPTPAPGESGTTHLARRYLRAGAFLDPPVAHPELVPAIGADRYPVTWRQPGERVPLLFRR
jgi:hypothetical protein